MRAGRILGRLFFGGAILFAMMGIAESPNEWMVSPPVTAHESVDCGRCHLFLASTSNESMTLPNQQAECRGCHMASLKSRVSTAFPMSFHDNVSRDCRECHFFHKRNTLHTDTLVFASGRATPNRDAVCVHCHKSGGDLNRLSPGHQQAASIVHSGWMSMIAAGPSAICLACHSEHSATQLGGMQAPMFDDKMDHPQGVVVKSTSMRDGARIRATIDNRLRLVDSRLECLTCHDLMANNLHRLVISESQTALCLGCHEFE